MRSIFKYPLDTVREQTVLMPRGAKVRHVAMQHDRVTLWAEVETTAAQEPRRFSVFGTGWEIPGENDLVHVGTVQGGAFVWHVFERIGLGEMLMRTFGGAT